MPFFRVTLKRQVSRVVELRQHTTVAVEAVDAAAAQEAVRQLAGPSIDDEFDEYHTGWADDDASRQASNDEVIADPTPILTVQISMPWRDNWLPAMPASEPKETDE